MIKKFMSLAALLLCSTMIMAQTPQNRTVKTTVADVLAQMPAVQQDNYNNLISDLSKTGDEGIQMLVTRLASSAEERNAQVEYAISGLTNYASEQGRDALRQSVAQSYCKAIASLSANFPKEYKDGDKAPANTYTCRFLIKQLQNLGGDESVPTLTNCLNTQVLVGPAARALARINTAKAKEVLVNALKQDKTQKDLVKAIAETGASDAEQTLIQMLGSNDEFMQKEVLYALSRVGSNASMPALAAAAKAANYTFDKSGANEAYIALLKRIAEKGDAKSAYAAAAQLQIDAAKAGMLQTREAALQIMMMSSSKDAAGKLAIAAMKDNNIQYRNAALRYASDFADQAFYTEIAKTMLKAKPASKTDIINWLGRESVQPAHHDMLKNLDIRFDLPLRQALLKQLKGKDFGVKTAAVWALVKMGDTQVIPSIAQLLTSKDGATIALGKNALAAFKGDIDVEVAKTLKLATDSGKIAGLDLLALRMADANLNNVIEQTKATSPAVKAAAYKTLKSVVTEKNFTLMCGMLETADASAVAPLQEAVSATLSQKPIADRSAAVNSRMLQAGQNAYLYYPVLASTGDMKVLPVIAKAFKESTGATRESAFNALLSWKDKESLHYLLDVCRDASASEYFDRAFDRDLAITSLMATGENRVLALRDAMTVAKTDAQKNRILNIMSGTGAFQGLLFASNYLDNPGTQQAAAMAVTQIALSSKEYTGNNVKALINKSMSVLTDKDADYLKQALRKQLAEMPDETGFVSIFNGKDLTGWKGLLASPNDNPFKRAQLKPEELAKEQAKADESMARDWKVENGMLTFVGSGYDNICTVKKYRDFEMYVDWMLDPAGPEADAGVYLRGTPQVQIWDTARVNVGAQVGSGGLYNNFANPSKPTKVADNKLGEWNSFFIRMVGDRVTVVLNGEKVVDDVILDNYWDHNLPIPSIEDIEIQAHGSKVYYRDIYVKELNTPEPFTLSPEEQKEGYKVLFDGTNMNEWTGNLVDYTLRNGCIAMDPSKAYGGNLYTKKEFSNFIYRFDFKLTPGANNGVGIRTPMTGDAAYVGMEVQILDCENPIYKDITPLQHHGSVYGIIAAKPDHHSAFKPAGEWNTEEIYANGDNIRVTVNGQVITEGNIREATKDGTPDHEEHPGLFNKSGHIAFLGHGSPVEFRNIRIKELKK